MTGPSSTNRAWTASAHWAKTDQIDVSVPEDPKRVWLQTADRPTTTDCASRQAIVSVMNDRWVGGWI